MRLAKLILALLVLSCSLALAEPPARGAEITAYSGWSFLDAENQYNSCPECLGPFDPTVTTTLGSSMLFGFKGGYYINKSIELECGFAVAPGHRLQQTNGLVCIPELPCPAIAVFPFPIVASKAVAYQYEGNFVYNVDAGSVSPFVTFGVGGVSTDAGNEVNHDFAINIGGGAKFYFEKVGFRFEVNDHVIPDYFLSGKTEHDVQVQYGFIFGL